MGQHHHLFVRLDVGSPQLLRTGTFSTPHDLDQVLEVHLEEDLVVRIRLNTIVREERWLL
jgi:hypothetical protein